MLPIVKFSIETYLERIGFDGALKPDLATIAALIRCQQMRIPFENLNALYNNKISIQLDDIFEKLVVDGRGGYCYELNGLFGCVLEFLRVPFYFVAARPIRGPSRLPPTHAAIVAKIDGQNYLIDTGFGSLTPREPVFIDPNRAKSGYELSLGIDKAHLKINEFGEYQLSIWNQEQWEPRYSFANRPVDWVDFELANYWNSNNPDSLFTQKPIIVIVTPNGRKILLGNELKIIEDGETSVRNIDADEYLNVLWHEFAIIAPPNNDWVIK